MGVYTEYLDRQLSFEELTAERKAQLQRISDLRGRDVLVLAADMNKGQAPIGIDYSDLLPVRDQLAELSGNALDLIIETPGGIGEVAEDIVRQIRAKYDDFAVIVPGWAKSSGTIMAMAADDILMNHASALGPIDAQLSWQGKQFSAEALLEGMEKIKAEVEDTGALNRAYIPILQGISPGELQHAQNALDFAKNLVTQWLAHHKFKNWNHSATGVPATIDEKLERAAGIAQELGNHSRWLTHGRSLKISDLEDLRLKITQFSDVSDDFEDAVQRYHTLLYMTFATNIYKVVETVSSQIYRFIGPSGVTPQEAKKASLSVTCPQCQTEYTVQANLEEPQPIEEGSIPFPENNVLKCSSCNAEIDLADIRRQIEAQTRKAVVS